MCQKHLIALIITKIILILAKNKEMKIEDMM